MAQSEAADAWSAPLERRILAATLIETEVTDGIKVWIGLGATAPLTTGSFCRTLRHRIGLNSAGNGAIVSVSTATQWCEQFTDETQRGPF